MRRLLPILLISLAVVFACFSPKTVAFADEINGDDGGSTSEIDVERAVDELDLSALEKLFSELGETEQSLFGGSVSGYIKSLAAGESGVGYESFFAYALKALGASLGEILPLIAVAVGSSIAVALLSGIKGGLASKSVGKIAELSGAGITALAVLAYSYSAIKAVGEFAASVRTQTEVAFPLLFTLMTALGASGSIAVYKPAVAVFSFVTSELVTVVVLPLIIASLAFGVGSGLTASDGGSTEKLGKLTASTAKWTLGTALFVFVAFLSVNGITAAVRDDVSVRAAKFAISKYVPVVGGYLSEGFNAIIASVALVKNAVGGAAIALLFVTAVPVFVKTIVTTLGLRLAEALISTFSNDRAAKTIAGAANAVSALTAVAAGLAFCHFVFTTLIILSGNLVL